MITMSKKFKKTMAMAMAAAMAFSIPALPVYQTEKVEAATQIVADGTSSFGAVTVSEVNEKLTVQRHTNDKSSEVVYYAVTTKDKDGNVKYPKESAYEAAEFDGNGKAEVDLSWVNRKKEQVLCVATGASIADIKPYTVVLKAQDILKVTYAGTLDAKDAKAPNVVGNADEGYLTFTTGTKTDVKTVSAAAVAYRTTNGKWQAATGIDLAYYSKKGATLQMCIVADDTAVTPAGKIVNVKIKAKSKAPNVTINYNDKTVAVPKNVQCSVDKGKTWTNAVDAKANVGFGAYGWNGATEKTVYFRTAGDAKKAASKIKYVAIKKEETTFAKLESPVSGAAVVAPLPTAGSGKLDVRFKTVYKNDTALVFTNATNDIYQVAFAKKTDIKNYTSTDGKTLVAASSSAIVAKSEKKVTWATINAQDTTKQKVGTGTLSLKKGEKLEDYVILYRICDKKGTTINSETRISDVPGTVKQSVALCSENKVVTDIQMLVTGSAVLTVTSAGITSAQAKYTVGAYSDANCTTKYANLTVAYTEGTLKIGSKPKTVAGTYYVKVSVEGASTVLKVVVK